MGDDVLMFAPIWLRTSTDPIPILRVDREPGGTLFICDDLSIRSYVCDGTLHDAITYAHRQRGCHCWNADDGMQVYVYVDSPGTLPELCVTHGNYTWSLSGDVLSRTFPDFGWDRPPELPAFIDSVEA